jgi:hypothetical protein
MALVVSPASCQATLSTIYTEFVAISDRGVRWSLGGARMMLFRLVKVVNEGRAMYASILEKTSGNFSRA